MRVRTRNRPALIALAVALSIGLGAAIASAASSGGGPTQVDPASLTLPPASERPVWVRADGSIDQSRAPRQAPDWTRADGTVDCSRAPRTMPISTFDGRLLVDRSGRLVQMPSLTGCLPGETPEVTRAWAARATALQEADARQRGVPVPAPPVVIETEEPSDPIRVPVP